MLRFGFRRLPVPAILFLLGGALLAAQSPHADLQTLFQQGQHALEQGHIAEAEHDFAQAARLAPGIAEIHAQLGVVQFQQKQYADAVASLRRALQLKPSLPGLKPLLSLSQAELGHFQDAVPGLEAGFHGSTPPAVKRMCGLELERSYTNLHQDRNAVEVALALNRLYPNDPEVLYHTGKIFGNYAFLTMQHLASVAPNSIWRHRGAAEAYLSQGSYNEAISEYRAVLAIDPHEPDIHYWLGRTYLARSHRSGSPQDVTAARDEFEQELKLNPQQASAAYEIGEIDRTRGQLNSARTWFERALKEYPDFEEARLGVAAVFLAQHQPGLAISPLRKAIALRPADDVAWYRLAQAYRALGNTAAQQKALAEFQRLKTQSAIPGSNGQQIVSPAAVTPQTITPSRSQR